MRAIFWAAAAAATVLSVVRPAAAADTRQVRQLLEQAGVRGGLLVHVGCGDGRLTAALHGADRVVLGLDRRGEQVSAARQAHAGDDAYGTLSFAHWEGGRLPLIDNLANAVIVDAAARVPRDELLRVLAPQGAAVVLSADGAELIRKPRPAEIDDWTHYLHDASGNAVAHDSVVGPPRHLQWIGHPRWSRHHDRMASMSALVSAAGRLFYIMDEGSRVSIQLPAQWRLIARDAFNGVELWRQPIPDWQSHLWPLKSGPTQLARRLVATDRHVFVPLGFQAPLTQLDAVTGEVLRTYDGTKSTEEVLHVDGMLLVQVNEGPAPLAEFAPRHNVGDQRRVAEEFVWNGGPRQIKAIDVDSGRTLWSLQATVAPLSLAASQQHVLLHDGRQLICLDRRSGRRRWSAEAPRRDRVANNFGPKIVIYRDIVLYSGGDRSMRAFDAGSGELLWTAPKPPSGYQSPEDLLVVDDLVWTAPTTSTRDTGVLVGRDPGTGEVKKEFPPNVSTYWFHHRCYIAKATDKFLIPSRTGVEFIDFNKQDWDIHHWVRGGCLYGVMPANGLLYTPPHNCACYPEAKLFGFNALAPGTPGRRPPDEPENPRVQGPAFGQVEAVEPAAGDWPTFRHDNRRSGSTAAAVDGQLRPLWTARLGGRLTSLVSAGGQVFVAQVDRHTLHALDADSGARQWSFTAGGRIDSPPTIDGGRAVFGSADGWVYCLRAADGELVWKLRAAPDRQRLVAFGQVESVWPVHGSVLVEGDAAYFVAGRSNFLDGGLWWFKVEAASGELISRRRIDDKDPGTGADLQDRLQVLQMPVGLPDILCSDSKHIFMRSQAFDFDGNRTELGPHSGSAPQQGAVQQGETAHLFAPMGFLDDTWFHRAYWVYGRSFAGGHNGYYQAGKYAPAGRILVSDDNKVYGFGRKPQYLRWTTIIEHQLFSAAKIQPTPPPPPAGRGGARSSGSMVRVANAPHLDPSGKPLTVAAWVKSERPVGVIVARGGPADGYALSLRQGRPVFHVRGGSQLTSAAGKKRIAGAWTHVAGVLEADGKMTLLVDGQVAATAKAPAPIKLDPQQAMEVGADDGGAVGDYRSPAALTGAVDDVQLFFAPLEPEQVARLADGTPPPQAPALQLTFDRGDASDSSPHQHHGVLQNVKTGPGKRGRAALLTGAARGGGAPQANSHVRRDWTLDLPLLARAMTLAGDDLLIAGPPDVMDEEATFQQLVARDKEVLPLLETQQQALDGKLGGTLLVVGKDSGVRKATVKLDSLPVWDGMIAVNGRVLLANESGEVLALGAK